MNMGMCSVPEAGVYNDHHVANITCHSSYNTLVKYFGKVPRALS